MAGGKSILDILDNEGVRLLLDALTQCDMVACLMLGAQGHYYKISWRENGTPCMVSAETVERIGELAEMAVARGVGTSRCNDGDYLAQRSRRSPFNF